MFTSRIFFSTNVCRVFALAPWKTIPIMSVSSLGVFGPINSLEDYGTVIDRVNEYFSQPNLSPTAFNIRRAYLKAFFVYLVDQGALLKNPVAFPRRKDEGRARNIEPEVLERLLAYPNKKTFTGLRNYTLLLLSLDTGTRPGEALQLLPADFNLESSQVTIKKEAAKTRTTRTLPLSPLTVTWVSRLLNARPSCWKDSAPVFCSQDGKPMGTGSWCHILADYSNKLGVKVTPYDLRHLYALHSLREGMNVFTLQRIMGHADLNMTKRYLSLTQEDLKKEHAHTSPLNRLTSKRVRKL